MNDQQRAAMQMALELAEEMVRLWTGVGRRPTDVVAAMREALAQSTNSYQNSTKLVETQPQGEWVDLTDDEMWDVFISKDWTGEPLNLMSAVIAAFKEKNTPPSVEAAIEATKEATKERAARICDVVLGDNEVSAVIRSMK